MAAKNIVSFSSFNIVMISIDSSLTNNEFRIIYSSKRDFLVYVFIPVQCKQNDESKCFNIVPYLLELVQFKVNNGLEIAK